MRFKYVIMLCAFSVFLSASGRAAERELLSVNFANPHWREMMPQSTPKLTIEGNAVKMGPGGNVKTDYIPVIPGETVEVSFDASCKALVGEDFRVGWGTISYYDKSKKGIGHDDLIQIRGDTSWKTFNLKLTPSSRCAFFVISLAHWGSSGTAYYRNLKVSVRDGFSEKLVGDSNFEDILGVNYWFFKRDGKDWDSFKCQGNGKAVQDTAVVAAGKKSLRLSGGGTTMVSNPFPYNGEKLILSGWLRSDMIKAGKASWAGGGVQLVGLDDNGNHICHEDLYINLGTKPWTYYQREISMPGSVKKVQLWLRMFDGAKGTLWLDEICLRSVPAGMILPFVKEKSDITVDLSKAETQPINYKSWAGVDALYAGWLLRPDVQQCLPLLKAAGIEYIRFREICNMLDMYQSDDKDGKPIYNWTKFDKVCDLLVKKYHFIPVITIGTMPPALDRPGTRKTGWHNGTPPNDFKKWGAFMEAMFTHVVQRYGKEEANKWLWELWNEPSLPSTGGDYIGTVEEFVKMAEEMYLAKERVDKKFGVRIMTGLTSGGQSGASDEFIVAHLEKIGKLHLVEHRSRHYYAGQAGSINIIPSWIEDSREFQKTYPKMNKYPVGCTEWNCTAMSSIQSEKPWNATMAVKMVKLFLDSKLDYSNFFGMVDHPEMPAAPPIYNESGSLSMMTRPNDYMKGTVAKPVPKPVYNAFLLLNYLKDGYRLPLERTSEPVDGIAVVKKDGTIVILLTSYDEDVSRQPYETAVNLTIKGVGDRKYKCTRVLASDDKYGNSFGEWLRLGKPNIDNKGAIDKMIEKSKPVGIATPSLKTENGNLMFSLNVPGPGLRLIELKPVR